MKKYTFSLSLSLLLLGLLTFSSCKKTPDTLDGTWELKKYKYMITGATGVAPKDLPRPVTITFDDEDGNGTITGQTVSHTFTANYTLNDGTLEITDYVATGTDEEQWGSKFETAIQNAKSVEKSGRKLCIYFNGSTQRMDLRCTN